MGKTLARIIWESENNLKIAIKINRNQDPELFEAFRLAQSRGGLARDLMNDALDARNAQEAK